MAEKTRMLPEGAGSAGLVETKYFTFAAPPNELALECGEKLGAVTLAYETYGTLSPAKDNAVLILHALSGDAHVAGFNSPDDKKPGWWDLMVGPGKAFDTNRYFVICSNIIGGCKGSTGPGSVNPATGKPYGISFPMVTVRDMVEAQRYLIDHLGIDRLLCVTGGSLGGMQALQWAQSYPDRVRMAIPIATSSKVSAQAIAFDEVGRQAIMADPDWHGGNYYGRAVPQSGLSIARMVGHITYLSEGSMHKKFGRRLQDKAEYEYGFETDFQVENYLHYQGDSFVKRFDANSYLYITKAIDYFDLSRGVGSLKDALSKVTARFLVISFSSDWLFPPHQSREIVSALRQNDLDVIYAELKTDYGHDAFLLEAPELTRLISNFLADAEPAPGRRKPRPSGPLAPGRRLSPEDRLIIDLIEPGSRILDLGCGEGDLMLALEGEKQVHAEGIELSQECIQACVAKGLSNVHHGDLDSGLANYADGSMDYVILTNTIQVLHKPLFLIQEMARVGRKCIVSFPNFAHWRSRLQLVLTGRMPRTSRLPFEWHDSPNIHLTTIADFRKLCRQANLKILREIALQTRTDGSYFRTGFWPNLLADEAVFLLEG